MELQKRKKPTFVRTDFHQKPRFHSKSSKIKWRRADGIDSKIRMHRKGRTKAPTVGYQNPKEIRGLIKGMKPIWILNKEDLDKVGEKNIAIISGKLGIKKRIDLAKLAIKLNIKFFNFKPSNFLKEIEERNKKKKELKKIKESKDKEVKTTKNSDKIDKNNGKKVDEKEIKKDNAQKLQSNESEKPKDNKK